MTIGPVSRSQMSPNGSTITSANGASDRARCPQRRRARHQPHFLAAALGVNRLGECGHLAFSGFEVAEPPVPDRLENQSIRLVGRPFGIGEELGEHSSGRRLTGEVRQRQAWAGRAQSVASNRRLKKNHSSWWKLPYLGVSVHSLFGGSFPLRQTEGMARFAFSRSDRTSDCRIDGWLHPPVASVSRLPCSHQRPDPWAVLSVMGVHPRLRFAAPAANSAAAHRPAATQTPPGGGCVLPQVDVAPAAAAGPPPPQPIPHHLSGQQAPALR